MITKKGAEWEIIIFSFQSLTVEMFIIFHLTCIGKIYSFTYKYDIISPCYFFLIHQYSFTKIKKGLILSFKRVKYIPILYCFINNYYDIWCSIILTKQRLANKITNFHSYENIIFSNSSSKEYLIYKHFILYKMFSF